MAANFTSMASLLANVKMPAGVEPLVVRLPSPPTLEGPLARNDWLTRAQAYALNAIRGPESLVVVNRYIYTGLKDGWVVEIKPTGQVRKILRMSIRSCGRADATEDSCGRPLGVRADRQGFLVVADAYNGIFRIHPQTGQFRQLVDARNERVNGIPLRYINDLAVARDGTIYFTSSSTKWRPSQLLNIMFEGETSGRVLVYNPREILATRRVQELVTNLHYPNGLQLSPDESFLLIGEGGRSRIHRAWVSRMSPKFGTIDTFASNLPGFVDNIRPSPRGTYWVGLSRARHAELPSVLDTYGDQPNVRGNLIKLVNNNMIFDEPPFGIVVELDKNGNIIRSLQDPTGSKYTSISEVAEENGLLFIASKSKNFVGIIDLTTLPKPDEILAGTGPQMVNLSGIANTDLRRLLTNVNRRIAGLGDKQLRRVILLLVERLYQAKQEAKEALDQVAALRRDVQDLQQLVAQTGFSSPSPTPAATTTSSPFNGGGWVDNGGWGGSTVGTTSPPGVMTTTMTTTEASTTAGGLALPPYESGNAGVGGAVDGAGSGPIDGLGDTTSTAGTASTTSPQQSGTTGSVTTTASGATTQAAGTTGGTTQAGTTGATTQAGTTGATTQAGTTAQTTSQAETTTP